MTPSFRASTIRVFDLALGQMLWARRTLFTTLLVTSPALIAVVVLATSGGRAALTINGEPVGRAAIFAAIVGVLYLKFIIPALGVLYGTSLIADEVEDKTITYLFTRPIPRSSIMAGKYLAYLACATSMVLPSVTVVFLLMVPFREMAAAFGPFLQNLGALTTGLATYGAVFALAGVTMRRPLVAGLVFAFGWEEIALMMPGFPRYFTIAYFLRGLSSHTIAGADAASVPGTFAADAPSMAASLFWLLVVTAAALILAMRAVERNEYVLDQ